MNSTTRTLLKKGKKNFLLAMFTLLIGIAVLPLVNPNHLKTDSFTSIEAVQLLQLSKITSVSSSNPGGNSPGNLNYGISIWTGSFPTPYTECGHLNDSGVWESRTTCNGGIAIGAADAIGEQILMIQGLNKAGKQVMVNINVPAISNVNTNMRLYVDDLGATYHCRSDHNYSVFKYEGACDLSVDQGLVSAHRASSQNAAVCGNNLCQTGESYAACSMDCTPPDTDADGISDSSDNCSLIANADQLDSDGDKIGNVCDSSPYLTCTAFALWTDKTSYIFGDNITLNYSCTSPSNNAVASSLKIQGISPSPANIATDVTTLSNASTGSHTFSTSNFSKTNGMWTIKICTTSDCSSGYTTTTSAMIYGSSSTDTDKDGVMDSADNCISVSNADQVDGDKDGIGKACDSYEPTSPIANDSDGDGVTDSKDNCPTVWNSYQTDTDKDGKGDYCDNDYNPGGNCTAFSMTTDKASYNFGDAIKLTYTCTMPGSSSMASSVKFVAVGPNNTTQDLETISNVAGGSKWIYTNDFKDKTSGTWMIKTCIGGDCATTSYINVISITIGKSTAGGTDSDGDGIADSSDNCPYDYNPNQEDKDGDKIGSVCDVYEPGTTPTPTPNQDSDGDGVMDNADNCPAMYNPGQEDKDGDKIGTACDAYEPDSGGEQCSHSTSVNEMNCTSCPQSNTTYCSVGYSYQVASVYFRKNGALECASFYDKSGLLRTEWCYPDAADYPDDYFSKNASCNYEYNVDGTQKCKKCTYADGKEITNTCSGIVDPGGNANTCQNFNEGDLQCSQCYDSNSVISSKSCWTNGMNYETSSCDYYKDGQMDCMNCSDKSGKVINKSCWQDDYDSWNDYYHDDKVHCDYIVKSGGTNPYPNMSYSSSYYSPMCEICKKPDGTVVQDSCKDGVTPPGPIEKGYCEYYSNSKGLSCKSCYDEKGNFTQEVCDEGNKDNYCKWEDPEGDGSWCEVCYDEKGNRESERCDAENIGNEANPEEVQRQLGDMQENLFWHNNDLKEYKRLLKQIDRKTKEVERKIKSIDQDEKWMQEEGMDLSGLEGVKEKFSAMISDMASLKTSIESDQKAFEEELNADTRLIDSLSGRKTVTWDELDAMWALMRKADKYQVLRDIWQFKVDYYERLDNMVYQYEREKAQVMARMEYENIELDEDLDLLAESEEWVEEFYELYNEGVDVAAEVLIVLDGIPSYQALEQLVDSEIRQEFRDYFDSEVNSAWDDLRFAREDFNYHDQDQQILWESLNHLNQIKDRVLNQNWIKEEIEWVRQDLEKIEAAFEILDGRMDSIHQNKLEEVTELMPRANDLLEEAEDLLDEAEEGEDMEMISRKLWDKLDSLDRTIHPKLESIMDYVEGHWSQLNLSEKERSIVQEMIDQLRDEEEDQDCGKRCGRLEEFYGQNVAQLIQNLKEELVDEIVAQVTSAVMEEVVKYIEHEIAGKIIENVLAHFESLGGLGNTLLENTNTVLEEVTAINLEEIEVAEELNEEVETLTLLQEEFESVPVPTEELATEIAEAWEDVNASLETEPTRAELQEGIEALEALLERSEQAKYEEGLAYHDVPFVYDDEYNPEEHWFSEYVIGNTQRGTIQGYKDENGNLTYNFGPSDSTLRAEVLKMALIAFGYEGSGAGEYWWSPYENQARALGLSIVNFDLSQPVTRGEMMRLIYELGQFGAPGNFQSYFPDVTANDDWQPAEALFEAEIIKGQGATGFAELYKGLNRAETATIIDRAYEWEEASSTFEGGEEEENGEDEEETISFKKVETDRSEKTSMWAFFSQFLKALLPF